MFGELHQIYLLANMLGLGHHRFHVTRTCSISLDSALKIGTFFLIFSLMFSTFYLRSFTLTRSLWNMIGASLQIYFVRMSNNIKKNKENEQNDQNNNNFIASANMTSSVGVFDKLSKLQLIPAAFCVIEQIFLLRSNPLLVYFDTVTLMLNQVITLLFYLKVVLIKENADINVELIDA
jgi:hypothetical protein